MNRRARWGLAAVVGMGMAGCATPRNSTKEPEFTRKYGDFTYAEVQAVRQTTQKSCGLAVLACVLRYWDKPVSEPVLVERYPLTTGIGHSVQRLQAIAQEQGLLAFAVSMNNSAGSPALQLTTQITNGRPVIVAVRCPQGRYFGEPLPVIETLDARGFRPFGIVPSASGNEFKHHYLVVFGEDKTRYLVMDPAYGIVTVGKASLLNWWKDEGWAALLCSPAPAAGAPGLPVAPSPATAPR